MKLTFFGAARTVTGSCHLLETENTKILIDCGMFQGRAKEEASNEQPFPFKASELDFVLLTHSHIDHSGRIPKLYKEGYTGEVITTRGTADLCGIMLPDSGHIQEFEAEWKNRKRERAGKPSVDPIYTQKEAEDCIKYFKPVYYNEVKSLSDSIKVRFLDAGHMLGSSIIELWINENGKNTKIVFTGDLGNKDIPILRNPTVIEEADYVIMESTYGDRLHKEGIGKAKHFLNVVNETLEKGGNVVIPSFAVGRTQEIIYELNKVVEDHNHHMERLMNTPVFIDSPLAISATEIYRKNPDCYDKEAQEFLDRGDYPLDFKNLNFTRTAEESRELNERKGSCIIISASGMCEAGRIKHHLKHNLWKKNSTVLFVGYQAEGTLGRRLVEGADKVNIFGEEIRVNARMEMIDGYSGHADQKGLLDWVSSIRKKPAKIILVHGEPEVQEILSDRIRKTFGIETIIPRLGETIAIDGGAGIIPVVSEDYHEHFRGLEVINMIDVLKDEIEDMGEIIREELANSKDESKMGALIDKLKGLEKAILDVLE